MVLVDHMRARCAEKRGGGVAAITLEETVAFAPGRAPNILEVDEALTRLAQIDARKAEECADFSNAFHQNRIFEEGFKAFRGGHSLEFEISALGGRNLNTDVFYVDV